MKPSNIAQEHQGLAKVHAVCAKMDAIWRPTVGSDLGIDGQIEFLELGMPVSTGYILAVQIKSGPSYFKSEDETYVKYYASDMHRRYWRRLTLPVILILHDPRRDLTIYGRVKNQLDQEGPLLVRKDQVFRPDARSDLAAIVKEDTRLGEPSRVLESFKAVTVPIGGSHEISGIEFLLACTNPMVRYFELRMCRVNTLLMIAAGNKGFLINQDTYDFIHRCTLKCLGAQLTDSFLGEFEKIWYGEKVVPDIVVPLTPFGLDIMGYLWSNLDEYVTVTAFPDLSGFDARRIAQIISDAAQRASEQHTAWLSLGETSQ